MMPIDLWDSRLLDDLNTHILKDTKIPAVFVKKEMTDVFKIPSDWTYDILEIKKILKLSHIDFTIG
jgi:hypothetical protein